MTTCEDLCVIVSPRKQEEAKCPAGREVNVVEDEDRESNHSFVGTDDGFDAPWVGGIEEQCPTPAEKPAKGARGLELQIVKSLRPAEEWIDIDAVPGPGCVAVREAEALIESKVNLPLLPMDPSQFGTLEAHERGVCRPCSNMLRRGKCRKGNACAFCHRHGQHTNSLMPAKSERLRNKCTQSGVKEDYQVCRLHEEARPPIVVSMQLADTSESVQGHVWVPDGSRGRVAGLIKQTKEDDAGEEWCLISTASLPDFWVPRAVARGMLSQSAAQPPRPASPPSAAQLPAPKSQFFAQDCVSCLEPFTANQSRVMFLPCNHSCMHAECYGTWLSNDPQAAASCSMCRSDVKSFTLNR
jgi:hypothetical protein